MSKFVRSCHRRTEPLAWLVPGVILAFLPKCPACLAAYLALGTGLGLSLSAVSQLRAMLLAGCILLLAVLAFRRLISFCTSAKKPGHFPS